MTRRMLWKVGFRFCPLLGLAGQEARHEAIATDPPCGRCLGRFPVVWIAATLVSSSLQDAECSRIGRWGTDLKDSLETYRQAHGSYPDSLQALSSPNLTQIGTVYTRMDSGYEFAFQGRWYDYRLSVSNHGVHCHSTLKAR
jgi:hypothetical protein